MSGTNFVGQLSSKMGNTVTISKKTTTVSPKASTSRVKLTQKQLIQNARFRCAGALAASLKSSLAEGFRNSIGKAKLQNFSIMQLLKPEIISSMLPVEVQYENLKLSKGSLTDLHLPEHNLEARKLTITWVDNSGFMDCKADDEILLTIIYPEINKVELIRDTHRSSGKLEVIFSPFNRAKTAHCYLFMVSATTNAVSETTYFKVDDITA